MSDKETRQLLLSLVTQENAAPTTQSATAYNVGTLKSVVNLAKANGLLYCVANRLGELGVDLPFIREARLREEQKRQAYLKTLHFLNSIEENYDLKYILIKACSSIPHVPRDIDIFLSSDDKPKFSQILKDNGLKCVYDSVAESSFAGNGYMELDIYTSIIYGKKRFFEEGFLWNARVKEQKWGVEYYALQPYANYPLILVHSLFGHRVVSLLDFLHLQFLRDGMELMPSRAYAYQMGWGAVFDITIEQLEIIKRKLYNEVEAISFPYLFQKDFVLSCFAMLQGADRTSPFRPTVSLRLSLLLDRLVHELRMSPFYEPLERLKFPGRVATNLGLVVRRLRGDRKA